MDAYVADVHDGNFPSESETFFMTPERRGMRAAASVSALADYIGGCAPDEPPAPAAGDAGPENATPYGSPAPKK